MKPVLDPLRAFGNKSQWCCQCLKVGGVLWSPRGGWGWMRVIMLMIYIYWRGGSEMEDTADWVHLHDGFVRKFGDRWRWGSWSEKLFHRDGRRRVSTWERIAIFYGDGLDIQSIYKKSENCDDRWGKLPTESDQTSALNHIITCFFFKVAALWHSCRPSCCDDDAFVWLYILHLSDRHTLQKLMATPCFIIHEEEGPQTHGGLRDWSLPPLLFKGFNNETLKKTRNSQQCWSYCVISNVKVL